MKHFLVIFVSICCLIVAIKAAAVDPVVVKLREDNSENSTTESLLPNNEDCIQPKETGRCFALFYRFAYDMDKHECVEFIYGGCAGNSNNFETKKDCEEKCLQNKSTTVNDGEKVNTTVLPLSESDSTTMQNDASS